jgi:hypothetical protein
VLELGAQIAADYEGREPVLVASLKASVVFVSDLARALPLVHSLDFVELAGYGAQQETGGSKGVRLLKDLDSDLAGRWGGEEFVLLLPGSDASGGGQFAERVREALAKCTFEGRDGAEVRVTCSFGVAQHRPGAGERELFSAADRALYRAKRRGKNRVELETHVRSF